MTPQPGATLTGTIESGEAESSGTITLTISEDGMWITQVDVKIVKLSAVCPNGTLHLDNVENRFLFQGPWLIIDGNIAGNIADSISKPQYISLLEDRLPNRLKQGWLNGKFISPTEASGTIHVLIDIGIGGGPETCDFGTWHWTAKAK